MADVTDASDVETAMSDEAFDAAMRRVDTSIRRKHPACSEEEYVEFLRQKVEKSRASVAAGGGIPDEEVRRRAAMRREKLLRRAREQ